VLSKLESVNLHITMRPCRQQRCWLRGCGSARSKQIKVVQGERRPRARQRASEHVYRLRPASGQCASERCEAVLVANMCQFVTRPIVRSDVLRSVRLRNSPEIDCWTRTGRKTNRISLLGELELLYEFLNSLSPASSAPIFVPLCVY